MHGDRNTWDAADYIRNLLNGVSANATPAATYALSRPESDASLAAYRPETARATSIPLPPDGQPRPGSAAEMESMYARVFRPTVQREPP